MELSELDVHNLSFLFRKVYLPIMEHNARKTANQEWLNTITDFEEVLVHFEIILDADNGKTLLKRIRGTNSSKSFPTSFPSLRDELKFWQKQVIELTHEQQWMIKEWGEATTETEGALRQVHYTLKLFRLVQDPIEVFKEKTTIDRAELYVKALASSLMAVVLQPSSKSGIHSKFMDLVASNTDVLARWVQRVVLPKDLLKPHVHIIVGALKLWEAQWAESNLEVVSKLTVQEFSDMFLATRTILENIRTVQGLIKEINALREMIEQIDDYFARQRLLATIREQLENRIDVADMKIFLWENRDQFRTFIETQEEAQRATYVVIKSTMKQVLDSHTSFEGLKLLRKIIDKSKALAGTHSGALDSFLQDHKRDQLNRLSTEIRLIRKGFDVTDYLNEKEGGNVDMAQKLFERRLLYHRVKVSLLTIFPSPSDWDETPATIKIKDQYIELAKYLKSTEDKLHHKWFTTVQGRASKAMQQPILKKTSKGFFTTLQDTLMTIWDETRLFLQTRFQVPHVCHILLMQKPNLVNHNRAIIAILEQLALIVERLTPYEFVALQSCYSSVENALNLGTTHVTWPSLCLDIYIQELMESVERFQSMSGDVALISTLLEKRISEIMDHQMLPEILSPSATGKLSASGFFDKLKESGDEFFMEIRYIVTDLPPILLQVESLTCNSQTGTAPELQNYYDYWRERIYITVVKSLQDRFSELSLLLEQGPAQFSIQLYLQDKEVIVEPDLESIEREISSIVCHWVQRSVVVPYWLEGSCLPEPAGQRSFYERLSKEPLLQMTIQRDQEHCKRLVEKLQQVIDRWMDCTELWSLDKEQVREELKRSSPTLAQYDEKLQHYRNYWNEKIRSIEEQAVISCVTLQMKQLKEAALEHVDEWIRQLGETWLRGTLEKLGTLDQLVKKRHQTKDGSINIDISLLLIEIEESWYRLDHYCIQVPEDARKKLEIIRDIVGFE